MRHSIFLLLNPRLLSISLNCSVFSFFHYQDYLRYLRKEKLLTRQDNNKKNKDMIKNAVLNKNFFVTLNSKFLQKFRFLIKKSKKLSTNELFITSTDFFLTKQYLRKFKFYYQVNYSRYFPNNFFLLSEKKINMLAMRNVYILQGL